LLLGRPDVARERLNLMREAIDKRNLHEVTFAGHHEPNLWADMREYQRAEAVAAQTLELSQKEQFADAIARSQCSLGYARAQLGLSRGWRRTDSRGLSRSERNPVPSKSKLLYGHVGGRAAA